MLYSHCVLIRKSQCNIHEKKRQWKEKKKKSGSKKISSRMWKFGPTFKPIIWISTRHGYWPVLNIRLPNTHHLGLKWGWPGQVWFSSGPTQKPVHIHKSPCAPYPGLPPTTFSLSMFWELRLCINTNQENLLKLFSEDFIHWC